jgi:hypothetical protein
MVDNACEPFVDLSARFMLVSKLPLFPAMLRYSEKNGSAGSCGPQQEAGMMVCHGSYLIVLSTDVTEGVFPDHDLCGSTKPKFQKHIWNCIFMQLQPAGPSRCCFPAGLCFRQKWQG